MKRVTSQLSKNQIYLCGANTNHAATLKKKTKNKVETVLVIKQNKHKEMSSYLS